jgi:hypothetical protein
MKLGVKEHERGKSGERSEREHQTIQMRRRREMFWIAEEGEEWYTIGEVEGESETRRVRWGRERYVCTGISKRISEMGSEKRTGTMEDIVQKMKKIDLRWLPGDSRREEKTVGVIDTSERTHVEGRRGEDREQRIRGG